MSRVTGGIPLVAAPGLDAYCIAKKRDGIEKSSPNGIPGLHKKPAAIRSGF